MINPKLQVPRTAELAAHLRGQPAADEQAPVVPVDAPSPFQTRLGVLGAVGLNSPSGESFPDESVRGILWCCRTEQNLTGSSLPRISQGLARAWRFMLASQVDEALCLLEHIERQLDDIPPTLARPLRASTELLRAAGLAFQDDSLAALAIAVTHVKQNGGSQDCHAAVTLCRLGYWQLGRFDLLHSLPRRHLCAQWSKSTAMSAMLDLSIEAAAALDHLHVSTARRLAADAANVVETALTGAGGLAAFPACLIAQLLYEASDLHQAETILRDRLALINAEGSIECALRAYLVLARSARQRREYDYATLVLREAEALGERRAWPRLVVASLAERTSLLLEQGRMREARLSWEYLDRYAATRRAGSGYANAEVMRYRTLTRWRLSWAEAPSREAVAALRQLYHQCLQRRNLYAACALAIELAEMLSAIGESEEADALFFQTVETGAAAGLYQIFLEGGAGSGLLLRRAYWRTEASGSADRELLPFVGSLLARWDARHPGGRSAQGGVRASDTLTARERDILAMISQGFSNKHIARTLKISPETVKSHVKRIFSKLTVSTRSEAVSRGGSLGLL
jgi:ATP/maltotriose-dependent transcriptional regulator MalT